MRLNVFLPLASALFLALTDVVSAQDSDSELRCYFPDGTLDPKGWVCNRTAALQPGGASGCCYRNDTCYADGSCGQSDHAVFYRKSCTDSAFKNSACPKYCLSSEKAGVVCRMIPCHPNNASACCFQDRPQTTCCNGENGTTFFTYVPGLITGLLDADGNNRLMNSTSDAASSPSKTMGSTDTETNGNAKAAAIAVGVVLGVLLLLACSGIVVLWKKYKAEQKKSTQALDTPAVDEMAHIRGQSDAKHRPELAPSEAATSPNTQTDVLAGGTEVFELSNGRS